MRVKEHRNVTQRTQQTKSSDMTHESLVLQNLLEIRMVGVTWTSKLDIQTKYGNYRVVAVI